MHQLVVIEHGDLKMSVFREAKRPNR